MSAAARSWSVAAVLVLAVFVVYEPVRGFPFVVYDDKALVTENPTSLMWKQQWSHLLLISRRDTSSF